MVMLGIEQITRTKRRPRKRIANPIVRKAMQRIGIASAADISYRMEFAAANAVNVLISFPGPDSKIQPVGRFGEWTKTALDLSSALNLEPEEIWPEWVALAQKRRNESSLSDEILHDPFQPDLMRDTMVGILSQFQADRPRDGDILIDYFGLRTGEIATYEDVSIKYNISKERVRQLVERAINIIRTKYLDRDQASVYTRFR